MFDYTFLPLIRIKVTLHKDRRSFLIISRSVLLRMRNVEKYFRTGQGKDDNMAYAHCMLDTYGYKHTLRIYNTYSFSTTTMVARTCLSVNLYKGWNFNSGNYLFITDTK